MKASLEIPQRDLDRFQRDLKALASMSSRTGAQFINSKMYTILSAAQRYTQRADLDAIQALGMKDVSGNATRVSSSGRIRSNRKYALQDNAVANWQAALINKMGPGGFRAYLKSRVSSSNTKRILTAQLKGKKTPRIKITESPNAGQLRSLARRWIAKKLRSRGFLASTWKQALRAFDRYKEAKGLTGGALGSGRPNVGLNGFGKPAFNKPDKQIVATAANIVGRDYWGKEWGEKPKALLMIAWRRAWYSELRGQAKRLAGKLKEAARKMGATVR